jgi:diguanylate cyclase (GGDEF)-like protein
MAAASRITSGFLKAVEPARHLKPMLPKLFGRLLAGSDPTSKYKRVNDLFIAAQILLAILVVENLLLVGDGRSIAKPIIYGLMLVEAVILHAIFRSGRQAWAFRVTVWMGTHGLSAIAWTGEGLHDTAIYGYCILLVYAGILETRRQYLSVLSAVIANISCMGLAQYSGWAHFPNQFYWADLLDMIFGFVLFGYSVHALVQDLNLMIARFKEENEKVRQSEAEISRMVHHDLLTGLPNRIIGERDFNAFAKEGAASVLFIDLDHFKAVNDSFGHASGDELLRVVTNRLSSVTSARATLCRIGGDEFLVVSKHGDRAAVEELANRIRVAAMDPVEIAGSTLIPTFSIGIARMPEDGTDFDTLSRKADIALYSAKAAGRNIYCLYNEAMNAASLTHLSFSARLRDAITHGEMQVYYQPKVSLDTGLVEGAEALLRWFPREGGSIGPDEFIPVAESTGQIDEIGRWVIRQACLQCRHWQRTAFPGIKMSVNVSAAQFRRGGLVKAVKDALAESGLEPQYLELELTESILLHDEYNIGGQIAEMRQMGLSFSIDDFGKGYSNLGYLGKLDIGTLKIDRQFVAHMLDTEKDRALVGAIFAIANSLNLKTVAEGVETEETIEILKAFGCSSAQGYYWSRPVDPTSFEAYASPRPKRQIRA